MKYILIALGILVVTAAVGIYFFYPSALKQKGSSEITSFEDCQSAGNLVVETKPRECHTKDGKVFVEVYNGVFLKDAIVVTAPIPNQVISSPFKIEGKALGNWYSNNQLTAKLMDEDGHIIVTKQINALSDTNTGNFVNFVAAIDFSEVTAEKGRLTIESPTGSYPTGAAGPLIIPVRFK